MIGGVCCWCTFLFLLLIYFLEKLNSMKQKLMTKMFIAFVYLLINNFIFKRHTFSQHFSLLFHLYLRFQPQISSRKVSWHFFCILRRCSFLVCLHLNISLYFIDIKVGRTYFSDLSIHSKSLVTIIEKITHFWIGLFVQQFHCQFTNLSALVQVQKRNMKLFLLLENITQIEEYRKKTRISLRGTSLMNRF